MQHVELSELEHCCPVPQFAEQSTLSPVHGSVNEPHFPAAHVSGVQHVPETPHVFPPGAALQLFVAPQLTVFPWQSFTEPQLFAPHALGHWHLFEMHDVPPVQPPQLTLSPHVLVTVPHLPVQMAGGGGVAHIVQLWRMFPHPSETPVPGSQTPGLLHVSGVQPQVFVVVLQAALVHWVVPQLTVTPQPVSVPHLPLQSAIVGGTHASHWFVFALQMSDAPASALVGHEPQFTATPHESTRTPHWAPAAAHAGALP